MLSIKYLLEPTTYATSHIERDPSHTDVVTRHEEDLEIDTQYLRCSYKPKVSRIAKWYPADLDVLERDIQDTQNSNKRKSVTK
jgi:hypothetical protein